MSTAIITIIIGAGLLFWAFAGGFGTPPRYRAAVFEGKKGVLLNLAVIAAGIGLIVSGVMMGV